MTARAGRYVLRLAARALRDDRGVLAYLAGVCANAAWNLRNTPVLADGSRPERWRPSVAVLVPARNEERGIERCVRSLLAQEWEALSVIVLDDGSTDGTADVLARIQQEDGRLTVLRGSPLPDGWLGKPWACAQLAEAAADAELLVFADADTWHGAGMLAAVAAVMERQRLDMLSVVPRQELGGLWERWTVPIIPWALMTHLSPAAAQRFGLALAAGAVGQVLAFRRDAYERLGGHRAVRGEAAEDVAFARGATRMGLRWRVASGREVSACRMYRGRSEALAGLEKNLFPAMGGRTVPYVLAWTWLLRAFTWPALALVSGGLAGRRRATAAAGAELILGAATWLAVARKFGLPLRLAAEGPVVVAAGAFAAARSLAAWRTGRAAWKGRRLAG